MKALASAVLCLFGYALCFLPLRKLPLALFAVIVFPYLRDKKTSKSCYDSLRQFDLTGFSSDFRLFFRQRHFPFPKRRTRPRRREEQGKGKLSPPTGAGYQFMPRMARMSLFSRRLFMYSSRQAWGQPFSS